MSASRPRPSPKARGPRAGTLATGGHLARELARTRAAPRELGSYRAIGRPWLGASDRRTDARHDRVVDGCHSCGGGPRRRPGPRGCVRASYIVSSDAVDLEARVEALADASNRVHQLAQALQGVVLGLDRDQHPVRGGQRVHGQQAERRRAIDQDPVVSAVQLGQAGGQPPLARRARPPARPPPRTGLELDGTRSRPVDRRSPRPARSIGARSTSASYEDRANRTTVDAEAARGVTLRVEIDDQGSSAGEGEVGRQVDDRGRLADAALLVCAGRDPDHERSAASSVGHPQFYQFGALIGRLPNAYRGALTRRVIHEPMFHVGHRRMSGSAPRSPTVYSAARHGAADLAQIQGASIIPYRARCSRSWWGSSTPALAPVIVIGGVKPEPRAGRPSCSSPLLAGLAPGHDLGLRGRSDREPARRRSARVRSRSRMLVVSRHGRRRRAGVRPRRIWIYPIAAAFVGVDRGRPRRARHLPARHRGGQHPAVPIDLILAAAVARTRRSPALLLYPARLRRASLTSLTRRRHGDAHGRPERGPPRPAAARGPRFIAFGVAALVLITALGGRLFQLQVVNGDEFARRAAADRTVEVPVPAPPRAWSSTAQGRPVAVNVPSWTVKVRPADLPGRVAPSGAARALRESPAVTCRMLRQRLQRVPGLAIRPRARSSAAISRDAALLLTRQSEDLPGVVVEVEATRRYLDDRGDETGRLMAHVRGLHRARQSPRSSSGSRPTATCATTSSARPGSRRPSRMSCAATTARSWSSATRPAGC